MGWYQRRVHGEEVVEEVMENFCTVSPSHRLWICKTPSPEDSCTGLPQQNWMIFDRFHLSHHHQSIRRNYISYYWARSYQCSRTLCCSSHCYWELWQWYDICRLLRESCSQLCCHSYYNSRFHLTFL